MVHTKTLVFTGGWSSDPTTDGSNLNYWSHFHNVLYLPKGKYLPAGEYLVDIACFFGDDCAEFKKFLESVRGYREFYSNPVTIIVVAEPGIFSNVRSELSWSY